jgi:hypothetical protein
MINPNRSTLTRRLFVSTLRMCCVLMMIGTGALCWDSLVAVKAKSPVYALSLRATGSITANPNPIQVCDGSGLGITTLSWTSTGTSVVEVHLDEPGGMLLASSGPSGTVTTGKWVGNATQFFLQDASGGFPLRPENTLATVTVYLTGCSSPGDEWATSGNNINNTNTGNVGIGTANPTFKLEVNGEINATGVRINGAPISDAVSSVFGRTGAVVPQNNDYTWAQINKTSSSLADITTRSASDLNAGTVPIGRIGLSGNAGVSTFLRGDNTWGPVTSSQWTSGTNNISYNSGNVGIGATAPVVKFAVNGNGANIYNTDAWIENNLHVQGNETLGQGGGRGRLRVGSSWGYVGLYAESSSVGAANDLVLGAGSGTVRVGPGGSIIQNLTVPKGNVGIGTASPTSRLSIFDANAWPTSNNGALYVESSNTIGSGLNLAATGAGGRNFLLLSTANGASPGGGTFGIYDVSAGSVASSYRFVLNSAGNVGIGTLNPAHKLDVAGNVNSSGLCLGGDCKTAWSQVGSTSQWTTNGTGIHYNAGNVGIGTTAPTFLLDVLGSTNTAFRVRDSSGHEYLSTSKRTGSFGSYPVVSLAGGRLIIDSNGPDGDNHTVIRRFVNNLIFVPSDNPSLPGAIQVGQQDGSTILLVEQKTNGNVGIGTAAPTSKLHVAGNITVDGNINAKYQDVAEWVPSSQKLSPGTVVVLDPEQSNHVMASASAYDTRVAGVVTAQPGLILGEGGEGKVMVATTGRVKVKVDATRAPIKVGDLLVTSEREGMAIKSTPLDLGGTPIHRPGTLIGKALEPLEKGFGEILVLLSLQ